MTSTRTRSSVIATVALASAATLGLASAATAAEVATYPLDLLPGLTITAPFPNYVLDVDCDEWVYDDEQDDVDPYGDVDLVWVADGSLTVNFSCEPGEISSVPIDDELDATDFESGFTSTGDANSFSVYPNTELVALLPDEQFIVTYTATLVAEEPSGGLLFTEEVSTPANGTQTVDFADGEADDDFVCGIEEERVYGIAEITVLESGEYTFRVVDVSPLQSGELRTDEDETDWWIYQPNPWGDYVPISDPYLVLYKTFDPAAPNEGQVDCNDDASFIYGDYTVEARDENDRYLSDLYSELIVELEPGEYTLLLTTYDEVTTLDSSTAPAKVESASAPLTSTSYELDGLPEQSATIEFWGVDGGLELGHADELAETGADQSVQTGLALGAILALLLGAVSVALVRRRSA